MNRKLLAGLVAGLGVVLVVAGLVIMLAIVPGMKKLPGDTDTTRTYTGTMATMLNPQTFKFSHNIPISITRHVKAEAASGNLAEVSELRRMTAGSQVIEQLTSTYAVDRGTMAAVGAQSVPAAWQKAEGYWQRSGVVFSWPIGVQKKDYVGWSDDYRATVPLKFTGEVSHARSGMKLYHFTSSSPDKPIAAAQVKLMGLPTELPKAALPALIAGADLGALAGIVNQQLPKFLAAWTQPTVPLQYFYSYKGQYWVDPATGILVDTTKQEVRKVGLGDAFVKTTPLAMLPTAQQAMMHPTVSDYTYTQSDASVKDAAKEAKDLTSKLSLFGTMLPLALIVVGIVGILVGAAIVMRGRRPQEA